MQMWRSGRGSIDLPEYFDAEYPEKAAALKKTDGMIQYSTEEAANDANQTNLRELTLV